jgi:hypothetical protein
LPLGLTSLFRAVAGLLRFLRAGAFLVEYVAIVFMFSPCFKYEICYQIAATGKLQVLGAPDGSVMDELRTPPDVLLPLAA